MAEQDFHEFLWIIHQQLSELGHRLLHFFVIHEPLNLLPIVDLHDVGVHILTGAK